MILEGGFSMSLGAEIVLLPLLAGTAILAGVEALTTCTVNAVSDQLKITDEEKERKILEFNRAAHVIRNSQVTGPRSNKDLKINGNVKYAGNILSFGKNTGCNLSHNNVSFKPNNIPALTKQNSIPTGLKSMPHIERSAIKLGYKIKKVNNGCLKIEKNNTVLTFDKNQDNTNNTRVTGINQTSLPEIAKLTQEYAFQSTVDSLKKRGYHVETTWVPEKKAYKVIATKR